MSRELGADRASTTDGAGRSDSAAARLFEEHRGFLWGLTYRLTGNAADADDIVQETFVRAIARPAAVQNRDWRPWLVRVAINLGRDLLRYRRRRGYDGTWLPSPVDVEPPSYEPAAPSADPASRYDLMESVSFAFLVALEALTPMQRAVLLLRDVFDYSVRETSRALRISEANARTTHVRATSDAGVRRAAPADGPRADGGGKAGARALPGLCFSRRRRRGGGPACR